MSHSVFISYRRSDTAGHALSLFHQLRLWFDTDELFFDQSGIDIGDHFPDCIEAALDRAKVVVVVIGSDWLTSLNERVTQPGIDYVRAEVAHALASASLSGCVIPVLMGETQMPTAGDLVEPIRGELAGLFERNAHTLKGPLSDLDAQFKRLVERIALIDDMPAPRFRPPADAEPPRHVPYSRNPNFTGREQELDALHQALTTGHRAALTALAGLGGVGKTQLALEYSYRYEQDYVGIWWFRAETPETLGNDMRLLADELDLSPGVADQNEVMAAVHAWLDLQDIPWLLVYDNATGPEAALPFLPPRRELHHIIATSRHTGGWAGVAEPLEVATLKRGESVAFLLNRTRQQDRHGAEGLAEALGDLPLALEQAGATIGTLGLSIDQYLEMLVARRAELLDRRSATADYPDSVATTWSLAFEAVEENSPVGAALLNLLSFFSPDAIPQSLITEGGEALPDALADVVGDTLALADGIGALRGHSLVEVEKDTWSVHRLVQAITRDRLGEDAAPWAAAAVTIVNNAFRFDHQDPNTWTSTSVLLSHALTTATLAERRGCVLRVVAQLLDGCGRYVHDVAAQLDEARRIQKRALELAEKVYGPEDPTVASYGVNYAGILLAQRDLDGALKYSKRALAIQENVFGPQHPRISHVANNIGVILQAQGDLDEALTYVERALEIDEMSFGPEHPEVATDANTIGMILQAQGDLEGALEYTERALRIDEMSFGRENPRVATDLHNIGAILQAGGDLDGALEKYKRALAIDEKVYGSEHSEVATNAIAIGMILQAQGDLDGALKYSKRALAIFENVFGHNHGETENLRRNIESLGSRREQSLSLADSVGRTVRIFKLEDFPDRIAISGNDSIINNGTFFLDFSRPLEMLRWFGLVNRWIGLKAAMLVPVVHQSEEQGEFVVPVFRVDPHFGELQSLWKAHYPSKSALPITDYDESKVFADLVAQFPTLQRGETLISRKNTN